MEVAPDANPPVCRIMDYNRFKYETAQRAKESRKKATNTSIKEMKYRPKIGTGDFSTKTRQVSRFLEEGHKVKVTIMFRGREVSHPELGMKLLNDLADQVAAVAKVEAAPKLDGRNMTMVLAPDRRAKQAARRPGAPAEDGTTEIALDDVDEARAFAPETAAAALPAASTAARSTAPSTAPRPARPPSAAAPRAPGRSPSPATEPATSVAAAPL